MDRQTSGTERGARPAFVRLQAYVQDPSKRDAVVRLLQSPTRWAVLSMLAGQESVPLDDLAAALKDPDENARNETQARTRLFHVDLPALADAGLVEWDVETRTARLRADGRELVSAPPASTPFDD
jgi:hypothetical protein